MHQKLTSAVVTALITTAAIAGCATPTGSSQEKGGSSPATVAQSPTTVAITTQPGAVAELNKAVYRVTPLVVDCKTALKDKPQLADAKMAYAKVYTAGNALSATAADLIESNNWDASTVSGLKDELAQKVDALNAICQPAQGGASAIDIAGVVVDVLWKIYDGYKGRPAQPRKDLAAIIRKKTFPLWDAIT